MTSVHALPAPAGPAAPVGNTVMEASHHLDVSLRLRLAAYREGYEAGRDGGLREGYEYAMREMERRWRAIAQPVSRGGLSYAELEARPRRTGKTLRGPRTRSRRSCRRPPSAAAAGRQRAPRLSRSRCPRCRHTRRVSWPGRWLTWSRPRRCRPAWSPGPG